jgi:hypothetical protein
VTTTKTQPGKSRVLRTVTKTQSGKSNLNLRGTKTQPGKANIFATTVKTQSGKGRIGSPTPVFIRNVASGANKSPVTPTTINVVNTLVVGDLLVMAVGTVSSSDRPISAVTDVRGNTWHLARAANSSGDGVTTEIWYTQITTQLIKQFSNISAASVNASNFNWSTIGSTTPSCSITSVVTPAVIVSGLTVNGPSFGDSFTDDTDVDGGDTWHTSSFGTTGAGATSNINLFFTYKISSATSTFNYQPTITSRVWAEVTAAMKS